ncbi:hypothetical protein GOP47_0029913 [Adiantum capillus-veneris]|nr:hypothetical protein GOP47_0029913 [Adiantum capillus-veneris]
MKLSKQKAMESVGKMKDLKQNVVQDPRFARLHTDPRFQRAFKRKLKIPIDSRFRHIFSDNRFSDPLALDKRGRKRQKHKKDSRKGHPLQEYYDINDDVNNEGVQEEGVSVSHQNGKQTKHRLSEDLEKDDNHPPTKRTKKDLSSRNSGDFASGENIGQGKKSTNDNDAMISTPSVDDTSEDDPDIHPQEVSESEEETDSKDVSEESSETHSTLSSSSEHSSDEEDTADSPSEEVEEEKVPTTETETRRLALVNMDWDHIRAVDILAVMNSFLPKGGQIVSVLVFPSEFGLQQMKEEEKRGPQALFQSESSDEDEEDADEGLNMERLRQYERDKLRYYYAVVECNSKETADFLYRSCDGMEFERTSNTFDLRFIPDDMKFLNDPRDIAKEVPSDYQAPLFETRALQHSKVKLTWDDDEPDRVKTLHQRFNADQLNDMDFQAYLASDDSDSEVGEDVKRFDSDHHESNGHLEDVDNDKIANGRESAREKYRALLLCSEEEVFEGKDKSSKDLDMEITFHSGLEELSKRLMDKTKQKDRDETVWEAYLRKKKEKRKLQKQQSKHAQEDDNVGIAHEQNALTDAPPHNVDNDAGFDDPFFKSSEGMDINASEESDSEMEMPASPAAKRKNGAHAQKKAAIEEKKREEERSRAELELLFADELASGSLVKGYNLKKNRKDKRKDVEKLPDKLPTVNYEDPRFSALFTSHRFAIDPTEPEFKRSAAHLRSLLEKQQKHLPQVHEVSDTKKPESSKTGDVEAENSKKAKQELSMLVRSLKRKVGAAES